MKVWIVTESGCEYTTIIRVCDSKEKALWVAKFQIEKYGKKLITGQIEKPEIVDLGTETNLWYPGNEGSPEYKIQEWEVYTK